MSVFDQFRLTDRVAVVEDVITTGGSALKAIDAIRAAGATSYLEVVSLDEASEVESARAALALGVVKGALACHSGMATFAEAGVSAG